MQTGLSLPFLFRLTAILMFSLGTASAAPAPEGSATGSSQATSAAAPSGAPQATPVQDAAKDKADAKDQARLSTEPDPADIAKTAKPFSPKGGDRKVDARLVPEVPSAVLCSTLAASAEKHDLPVALFANLIWQESRFDSRVVSRAGAQGVAQFMPKVAKEVGLRNPFNPLEALPAAARFLGSLVERFGSLGLATAAYNAGPTRVDKWLKKGGGLPKETQHYVRTITGKPAEHWRSEKAGDGAFAMAKGIPCRLGVFAQIEQTGGDSSDGAEQRPREIKLRVALRSQAPRPAKFRGGVAAMKVAIASKSRHAAAAKVAAGRRGRKALVSAARTRAALRHADGRIRIAGSRS